MKIKSQEIKQLNITAVFEEINIARISPDGLQSIFDLNENDKKMSTVFEGPGVKVLIMPTRQKEIVIEQNRLLINDKDSKKVEDSQIVNDFQKATEKLSIDITKLTAYGFNYDLLIETLEPIDYRNFAGEALLKTLNGADLLKAGTRMIYKKDDKRFDLQTAPAGSSVQFILHLNVHYPTNKLDFKSMETQFIKDSEEIKNIINQLE